MTACSACSEALPDGARFCLACGTPQVRDCSVCGANLPGTARFCMSCGTPTRPGPATPTSETGADPVPDAIRTTSDTTSADTTSADTTSSMGGVSARRVVPVLFGDLVGFTSLSESRDQEEVRELLSDYFEVCRSVLERHGGIVEKFIGDAVMAVWGVPVTREDDAERAVRAGLELIDAIEALGERVELPGLAMRVGIVTGEVAVTVGARGQGMVAGDPVNTASRVQGVADPGQVLVDETTKALSQAAITYTSAGVHALKGKEHPVPLWRAVAVVANIGGAQRADGLEAPLVGRDRELRLVKDIFHRTQESRSPNLLIVAAAPGLGKSRLAWEFSKYVDGLEVNTRWLEGRCPAYGDGAAFHALAEALRGRLRAFDGDTGTDLGHVLDDFLTEFVPSEQDRTWLRPPVASLLGLPGAGSHSRQELFAAWVAVLEALSVDSSAVVLVIEDGENADEGLTAFLEFALGVKDLPLFVLLLARPELLSDRPGLVAHSRTVTAHLHELTEAEMGELVSSLVSGLPESVRDGLVERASGVPLFAVETVRSLIDKELVTADEGRYVLVDRTIDVADVAAPVSLHTLIASRLDALPGDLRRVIDLASVLGRSFRPAVLAGLVGEDTIEPALAELVRRQFLEVSTNRLAGEFGWYSFPQDVVRQVAYSMLARRDRRTAHLAVAEALEAVDSPAELPMLAQHLVAAAEAVPGEADVRDLQARAADAFDAASAWALGLGSWGDAIAHVERALELVEDPASRVRLLCRITAAAQASGDWDRGVAAGREAIELGRVVGDEVAEALAAGLTGFLLTRQRRFGEAEQLVSRYWEHFRDRTDADEALYWLARTLCLSKGEMGDWDAEVALVMLRAAEHTGDRTKTVAGLSYLAVAFYDQGLRDSARTMMTGAAAFAREHRLKEAESTAESNLGYLVADDDLHTAIEASRASTVICRELHLTDGIGVAVGNLSEALYLAGDWDERDAVLDAEAADLPVGVISAESVALYGARIALARGEPQGELPLVDEDADPLGHADVTLMNAQIRFARGDAEDLSAEVEATLDSMRGLCREDEWVGWLVEPGVRALLAPEQWLRLAGQVEERPAHLLPTSFRAHRHRCQAHQARLTTGPSAEVVQALEQAISAYREWGGLVAAHQTGAELAEVLDALGDHGEAARLRADVRAFYERLRASAWLAALDRAGASAPAPG